VREDKMHDMLDLTPPTTLTFFISVALATVAAIVHYTSVHIPYTHSGFSILIAAYGLLLIGNLLRHL
jgi:hypothetical protein